ncbi:hypothetical protein LINGRAHAP2_LOCUS19951 [Linum grandiflorum]
MGKPNSIHKSWSFAAAPLLRLLLLHPPSTLYSFPYSIKKSLFFFFNHRRNLFFIAKFSLAAEGSTRRHVVSFFGSEAYGGARDYGGGRTVRVLSVEEKVEFELGFAG